MRAGKCEICAVFEAEEVEVCKHWTSLVCLAGVDMETCAGVDECVV